MEDRLERLRAEARKITEGKARDGIDPRPRAADCPALILCATMDNATCGCVSGAPQIGMQNLQKCMAGLLLMLNSRLPKS